MQVQLYKVRLLGGEWVTVETIRISECSVLPEGIVVFWWYGIRRQWELSTSVISMLRASGDQCEMDCTFTIVEGKFVPVAVVCGSELYEPNVLE